MGEASKADSVSTTFLALYKALTAKRTRMTTVVVITVKFNEVGTDCNWTAGPNLARKWLMQQTLLI
jgi:hypothetical protein